MNYYPFHIGDYASHTRGLTLMEDLAYRRLLDEYYIHERALNECSTSVARQIGMREHQDAVDFVLKSFFELTTDGWINRRADQEISKFHLKQDAASRAGRASAERRLNERSTDVQRSSTNQNQEPEPEPSSSTKKRERGSRLSPDTELAPEWEAFCRKDRPDLDPVLTFEKFKDYWLSKAGAGTTKLDWTRTWRNWVRNEKSPPQQQGQLTFQGERNRSVMSGLTRGLVGGKANVKLLGS